MIKRYIINILITMDQGFNALIGGNPDMTLSGRMGRYIAEGRKCYTCHALCWLLDIIDKNHCLDAARREKDESSKFESWRLP